MRRSRSPAARAEPGPRLVLGGVGGRPHEAGTPADRPAERGTSDGPGGPGWQSKDGGQAEGRGVRHASSGGAGDCHAAGRG